MDQETSQSEPIDLIPAGHQIQPRAFVYEIKIPNGDKFFMTVIAPSSSDARENATKQLPQDTIISFMCECRHILQVH